MLLLLWYSFRDEFNRVNGSFRKSIKFLAIQWKHVFRIFRTNLMLYCGSGETNIWKLFAPMFWHKWWRRWRQEWWWGWSDYVDDDSGGNMEAFGKERQRQLVRRAASVYSWLSPNKARKRCGTVCGNCLKIKVNFVCFPENISHRWTRLFSLYMATRTTELQKKCFQVFIPNYTLQPWAWFLEE